MKKTLTTLNITEIENSVNHLFECEEKNNSLQFELTSMHAEYILMQHLQKAFSILDPHFQKGGK